MNENLTKICRICLTEGSRNIFQKTVSQDGLFNVSSLNRISEKLRYVTLLKVDELENLPPMICDLCIVQLNVAYNFKRQATDSDTKLRQYMIENGIDIMKDPRCLTASRQPAASTGTSTRAITSSSRTNQRCNSASSSSVQEVATSNCSYPGNGIRLRPIRIKVEMPEPEEPSPDSIELLSSSTISPLSSATSPVATSNTEPVRGTAIAAVSEVADSSPSSSKISLVSSGRDSTMVILENRQSNAQADREYIQQILGSNSSLASSARQEVQQKSAKDSENTENRIQLSKTSEIETDYVEDDKKRRMRNLLSSLTINMVTSRFPKSKLRIKARKKLQKNKDKEQHFSTPRSAAQNKGRMSQDNSKPDPRLQNLIKARMARHKSTVISSKKLKTLREKMREERDKQSQNEGGQRSKRNTLDTKSLEGLQNQQARTTGDTKANAIQS